MRGWVLLDELGSHDLGIAGAIRSNYFIRTNDQVNERDKGMTRMAMSENNTGIVTIFSPGGLLRGAKGQSPE